MVTRWNKILFRREHSKHSLSFVREKSQVPLFPCGFWPHKSSSPEICWKWFQHQIFLLHPTLIFCAPGGISQRHPVVSSSSASTLTPFLCGPVKAAHQVFQQLLPTYLLCSSMLLGWLYLSENRSTDKVIRSEMFKTNTWPKELHIHLTR